MVPAEKKIKQSIIKVSGALDCSLGMRNKEKHPIAIAMEEMKISSINFSSTYSCRKDNIAYLLTVSTTYRRHNNERINSNTCQQSRSLKGNYK